MNFHIEIEREDDGRWIPEVLDIPGLLHYGSTAQETMSLLKILALGNAQIEKDRFTSSAQAFAKVRANRHKTSINAET